ncbi:MAG: HupE/UreJ family protein [Maricaulaceae bacterium]|jgi:hypothetical protein
MIRLLGLFLGALVLAAPAVAHEVRPAFLQIREVAPQEYDVLWKTPAQGRMRLSVEVILPESCTSAAPPRSVLADGAVIARWRETCTESLVGQEVGINDLEATLTDAIVRFEPLEGPPAMLRLTPDAPRGVLPAAQSWRAIAASYFGLGVEHILLGFDHLLFVLALLILVGDVRRLLGVVTAFTLAHSLTLAATTFGLMRLPSAPVEAAIALSIAFVAAEIVHVRRKDTGDAPPTTIARWPWIASFGFGLLHGFGFAGALREIGIPDGAAPLALAFFNLGVEVGQVAFILAVLALIALARQLARLTSLAAPAWAWRAPVYVIGTAAAFWFIERAAAILSV